MVGKSYTMQTGSGKIPVKSMVSQFLQNEEIEVSVVNHAYEFKFIGNRQKEERLIKEDEL